MKKKTLFRVILYIFLAFIAIKGCGKFKEATIKAGISRNNGRDYHESVEKARKNIPYNAPQSCKEMDVNKVVLELYKKSWGWNNVKGWRYVTQAPCKYYQNKYKKGININIGKSIGKAAKWCGEVLLALAIAFFPVTIVSAFILIALLINGLNNLAKYLGSSLDESDESKDDTKEKPKSKKEKLWDEADDDKNKQSRSHLNDFGKDD